MTHVLYELKSSQPFLRSRACWVYEMFSSYDFKDENHVKQAIDGIYHNLFAEDLPVRLSAAIALSTFLRKPTAVQFLKPALRSILEVYLKIISEIDSEKLVSALEEIMLVYKDDMGPFSLQISEQLV